jgi:hypothetical protein
METSVDLGQRPHTTLDIDTLNVARESLKNMDEGQLRQFCHSVGVQLKPEWRRPQIMHAIVMATYEASAARVEGK